MSSAKKLHVIAALQQNGVFNKKQKLQCFCFGMDKEKLRTFFFHFGLLVFCICYIFAGAAVFYWIEKPHEITLRNHTLEMIEVELTTFLDVSLDILVQSNEDFIAFNKSVDIIFDHYEGVFFELFKNPISSNVFDALVYGDCCSMSTWNPMSALLMASTTVIPVGFGFITPLTTLGRMFLVVYAIIGVPLTLIVTSDIGKFVCGFIFSLLDESPMRSMLILMTMLLSYPILMGLAISAFSSMKIVDSLYYSIMCIFTIGYGDILPPISVPILILMIAIGVTLVTVSVELVGSTIIHNVHYMGRQMSRAREIAGRVIKMAQKINVNRGLTIGISQLNAFTRLGMAMDFSHRNNRLSKKDTAFEPEIALDFVDFASTSGIFLDESCP